MTLIWSHDFLYNAHKADGGGLQHAVTSSYMQITMNTAGVRVRARVRVGGIHLQEPPSPSIVNIYRLRD